MKRQREVALNACIAGTKLERGFKRLDGVPVVALSAQGDPKVVHRIEVLGVGLRGRAKFPGRFLKPLLLRQRQPLGNQPC